MMSVIDAAADGDSVVQVIAGPVGGSMRSEQIVGLINALKDGGDGAAIERQVFARELAREMLGYSRWRDFSMSAREQYRREKTGEHLAEVGPIGAALAPLAPLPYPRWPHGVL